MRNRFFFLGVVRYDITVLIVAIRYAAILLLIWPSDSRLGNIFDLDDTDRQKWFPIQLR